MTFPQIEGVPITNSTQQPEPTKPAQQGIASEPQYAVTTKLPDKDEQKHKEMDREVCMCLHT